jgi:pSer/pThr/pTyr-binding forkhead associated (FHA) protein
MSAQLVVTAGPDRGRSFPLTAGTPLRVGRSARTNTKLSDASVSRLHCEVHYDGSTSATLTNHSNNGTLVNGQPATRQELRHGDLIRIGSTELRFQVTALEESDTLLQPGEAATAIKPPPAPGA